MARAGADGAELLDSALRSHVPGIDDEQDRLDEPERVVEHQALQLTVVDTAPVGASQERPADLDLAARGVVAVIARGSDDLSRPGVQDGESAARRQMLGEEGTEDVLAIPGDWMLIPDQRVARRGEERIEVVLPQGTNLDELAAQRRLEIEAGFRADGAPKCSARRRRLDRF